LYNSIGIYGQKLREVKDLELLHLWGSHVEEDGISRRTGLPRCPTIIIFADAALTGTVEGLAAIAVAARAKT